MKTVRTNVLNRIPRIWLGGVLVVLAGGVFAGGSLFVYDDNGQPIPIRWDDRMQPVRYVLSSDGYPTSTITNAELAAEFGAAIAQYNALPESDLQLAFDGEIDNNNSGGESRLGAGVDGINLITFNDPDLSFGPGVGAVCAQTVIASELVVDDSNNDLNGDGTPDLPNGTYPAGTILDADIVFDGNLTLENSGADGTADIRALALHEIGHCVGLSHSSVRDAVMFPFQSSDVASARILKEDDAAHLSDKYPLIPDFGQQFGSIEGRVISGVTGRPVAGAHVYAADTTTREQIVGAYTGLDGSYRIPVRAGSYLVGIEPLDGDPVGLDPERINRVIADTTDVFFPEEFFDSAESSTDAPDDAAVVSVAASVATAGTDIVTNTLDVLSSSLLLERGINYMSYPVSVPLGITAFDLLTQLSVNTQVQSIQRLNPQTGQFETAHLVDGVARGFDFPISRATGLIVHTTANDQLNFSGSPDCPAFDLFAGTNLIGAPCAPAGYSAYDLLDDLGTELDVISVQGWDPASGAWQLAQYAGADPAGVDFPIVDGGAYLVDMRVPLLGFRVASSGTDFPPVLLSISPGQSIPGGIVTLKGTGFAEDPAQNVVVFNDVSAEILSSTTQQLVVSVPASAVSGTVQVISLGLAGNALPFTVLPATATEVEGVINDIASGQTFAGELSSPSDVDDYRFLAIEGNRITVTVRTPTPGVPELAVRLLNPRGGELRLVSNGTGTTAVIRDQIAAETGFYTINISSLAGSGPYTVELRLEGVPGEPRLVAISGDYQTGVAGTELPVPLSIVAVDETGLPASGVPLSFAVQPVGQQSAAGVRGTEAGIDATRAMTAGDMATLPSGLFTATVQLPDQTTGDFEIVVTAPSRTSRPIELLVSAIARPIASVDITPATEYACADGTGCPVDEVVDIPYEMTFLDSDGEPIEDVLVEFAVSSGGGTVRETEGGADEQIVRDRSDGNGRVEVFHRLGERLYYDDFVPNNDPTSSSFNPFEPKLRIPQQVVATVPGQPIPASFLARARPGEPSIIKSLRSRNQRVSVGSVKLGAVTFLVADQYGNPVEGAQVSGGPTTPGVITGAGFVNGEVFLGDRTNADGIWSGGLGANTDGSLEMPTINEFGEELSGPFTVVYDVAGLPVPYFLDVDMGPNVIAIGIGTAALIGNTLPGSVGIQARRFQRVSDDDPAVDNGNWEDDDYSVLAEWQLGFLEFSVTTSRADGRTAQMRQIGIPVTTIDGEETLQSQLNSIGERFFDDVVVGGVGGGISILSDFGTRLLPFFRDGQVMIPYRSEIFTFEQSVLPIRARPIIVTVDLEDPLPSDPDAPRRYPGVGLSSGIDASRLRLRFNNEDIAILAVPDFPYFGRQSYDGQDVSLLSGERERLRPGTVQIEFRPSSNLLNNGEPNQIVITNLIDDLGHVGEAADPAEDTDQSPDTITFEFDTPR